MTGHPTTSLRWRDHLAACAIHCTVRACSLSWRLRLSDSEAALKAIAEGPVIFCLWHNRLAIAMTVFQQFVQRDHPARKIACLVSASRDGAILSRALEKFGATAVRGSSSRRGGQAMVELIRLAKAGHDIAITPDGPRGPRNEVQPGIITLAQLTGHPIIPCKGNIAWRRELNSWDRFQIPIPYTHCDIQFGEPFTVQRKLNEADHEAASAELQLRMQD